MCDVKKSYSLPISRRGFRAVLPIKGFQKPMDDDAFDIRRSEMIGVLVLFPRQMNKEEEEGWKVGHVGNVSVIGSAPEEGGGGETMGEANTVGTLPHLPDMYEQFLREIGRGAQFNFWCPSRAIHLARRRRREGDLSRQTHVRLF